MSAVSWLSAKAAHKQAVVARLKLRLGAGVEQFRRNRHRSRPSRRPRRKVPAPDRRQWHRHAPRAAPPCPRRGKRTSRPPRSSAPPAPRAPGPRPPSRYRRPPIARDPVAARPPSPPQEGACATAAVPESASAIAAVMVTLGLVISCSPDVGPPRDDSPRTRATRPEKAWRGCRLHALWKEPSRPAILRPRWTGSHTSSLPRTAAATQRPAGLRLGLWGGAGAGRCGHGLRPAEAGGPLPEPRRTGRHRHAAAGHRSAARRPGTDRGAARADRRAPDPRAASARPRKIPASCRSPTSFCARAPCRSMCPISM